MVFALLLPKLRIMNKMATPSLFGGVAITDPEAKRPGLNLSSDAY